MTDRPFARAAVLAIAALALAPGGAREGPVRHFTSSS